MSATDGSSTTHGGITDGRQNGFAPAKNCDLAQVDRFGRKVAEIADHWWRQTGKGPTWREMHEAPGIRTVLTSIDVEPSRQSLEILMRRARGRLWIATTREQRSLCAGPRYFGEHGRSRESADSVGRSVAQAIGSFR